MTFRLPFIESANPVKTGLSPTVYEPSLVLNAPVAPTPFNTNQLFVGASRVDFLSPDQYHTNISQYPNPIPINNYSVGRAFDLILIVPQQQPYNPNLYTIVAVPFSKTTWETSSRVSDFLPPPQLSNILIYSEVPFSQEQWPNTNSVRTNPPQQQPYNPNLFSQTIIPFNVPFDVSQVRNFPQPIQNYNINLYGAAPVAAPFYQTDWSKPVKAPDATWDVPYNLVLLTTGAPFAQLDWSKGKTVPSVVWQVPYNESIYFVPPVVVPFSQTDWSTTKFVPSVPQPPSGMALNINTNTNPIPFNKLDWGQVRPVTLIVSDQNTLPNIAGRNPSQPSTPIGLYYWQDWGRVKAPVILIPDQNNLPNIVLPNTFVPDVLFFTGRWIKGLKELHRKSKTQNRTNDAGIKKAAAVMSKMGGQARAKALTPNQRSKIASNAAKARWR